MLLEEAKEAQVNEYVKSLNKVSVKSFLIHQKSKCLTANTACTKSRIARIIEQIDIIHLDTINKNKVINLVSTFQDVFKLDDEPLPAAKVEPINIEFTCDEPINSKPYRLPRSHTDEAFKTALE